MNRTIYFTDSHAEYVIDCQNLFTYYSVSEERPKPMEIRLSLTEAQQLQKQLVKFINKSC